MTVVTLCRNILVGLSLMLNDHVLLMDGLQQSGGQGLQVTNGLWSDWETAAILLRQQQLLYWKHISCSLASFKEL